MDPALLTGTPDLLAERAGPSPPSMTWALSMQTPTWRLAMPSRKSNTSPTWFGTGVSQ